MDILKTNKANCKDCHKCIRHCPVNAIKFSDGHAQIDHDRCILDGKCYQICPQKAKSIRNDLDKVKELINSEKRIIASVAPSFYAYYQEPLAGKMLTALKKVGFSSIELTSRTAYAVSKAHYEFYKSKDQPIITSSCPAVVALIEKHYPDLLPFLAPVASPMVAHYRLLKQELGNDFEMVFIGPCIAKKEELTKEGIAAGLTFEELEEWLSTYNFNITELDPTELDHPYSGVSSLFPLLGGLIKTAGMGEDITEEDIISVNGINNIKVLLDDLRNNKIDAKFIELLSCEGGCVMGPSRPESSKDASYYQLKKNMLEKFKSSKPGSSETVENALLEYTYTDKLVKTPDPTEEEITTVLKSIGKYTKEDELNCGACGYYSCREKAKAVVSGMAEKEMCLPYMKSLAEKFTSILMEYNPTGMIVLDKELNVVDLNKALVNIIGKTKEELIGKNIATLTDPKPYKDVLNASKQVSETQGMINDRMIKRIIFEVPDQEIIIGFLIDVTDVEHQKKALQEMKSQTINRAQKVVEKQMFVAQEIASLLGETTAETKVLLGQLIKILQQE